MKHLLILIIVSLFSFNSYAQQVVKAEYFFNTDPGFGKGIDIPFTSSEDTQIEFTASMDELNCGIHTLFIRIKDDQGRWGTTFNRVFVKNHIQDNLANIVRIEYFIDEDPGVSLGVPINVPEPSDDVELFFIVDLEGYEPGEYTLFLRAIDNRGGWSMVNSQAIEVTEDEPVSVAFIIEDSDQNPITDAIITFNGVSHDTGQYNMGTFEPATYPYEVQREGYFNVTEQVELVSDTLITVILEKDNTGLYSVHGQNTRVFPNPASSNINIESPLLIERIVVADLSGRIFYTTEINEHTAALSLSGLESGIYFIHLETPLGVFNEKIVIQK